tara:strand:+ start:695 stop:1231 length:537 start_codon:yes stop_codon:yes gene_type:complete
MLGEETTKALNHFGERVVIDSKKNLKKKNKIASSSLINSISYKAKVSKNSFELDFFMEDYWEFVDYGVKGVGGSKADRSRWKTKRVTNNKFKYKDKRPPIIAFNGWTIKKGIAPRSKGGQFQKRRGLLFAIANSVYHTGLETTSFFTKPFDKEFKELPDEIVEAYAIDVEELLEFAIK